MVNVQKMGHGVVAYQYLYSNAARTLVQSIYKRRDNVHNSNRAIDTVDHCQNCIPPIYGHIKHFQNKNKPK